MSSTEELEPRRQAAAGGDPAPAQVNLRHARPADGVLLANTAAMGFWDELLPQHARELVAEDRGEGERHYRFEVGAAGAPG